MFTHIYKYSVFVVSPWFQKEITWSPNWWLFPCSQGAGYFDGYGIIRDIMQMLGQSRDGRMGVWKNSCINKKAPFEPRTEKRCSVFLKLQLFVFCVFFVWRISVTTCMDPIPFDGFIHFHNLRTKWTTNTTTPENVTIWDTPTMIWALEKGNFSLKQMANLLDIYY